MEQKQTPKWNSRARKSFWDENLIEIEQERFDQYLQAFQVSMKCFTPSSFWVITQFNHLIDVLGMLD